MWPSLYSADIARYFFEADIGRIHFLCAQGIDIRIDEVTVGPCFYTMEKAVVERGDALLFIIKVIGRVGVHA